MKRILACLLCVLALAAPAAPKKLSPIISLGAGGALVYDLDEHSNRVPDFSTCGYAGGDRPIPLAPVVVVVAPQAGDETARIQAALHYAGGLPVAANGLRGAVLLLKGRHEVFGGLLITNRGVVLRGQGAGADGTILVAAGNDRRTLIHIDDGLADSTGTPAATSSRAVADDYVAAGATSFHLQDSGGLKVGDAINIVRPSTKEWIDALGMTEFGGGIGDWRLVWKPGTRDLVWSRTVKSVDGDLVTIDTPITTAIEKALGGGTVENDASMHVDNVGIENLRLESEFDPTNLRDENHSWMAITMEHTADAWVRQVTFEHFAGSAVALYETCRRITVEDCSSLAPVSEDAGWRRNTFYTMGQQTLFLRCFAEYGRHDFAVGFCAAGPNAFVQCEATLPTADSGAIESWSAGTLFDNVRIDGNGLDLMNRGSDSEGAGWSAANSVLWQCSASKIACENPPGARNFAFGCWGEFAGNGVWRQANASVRPVSLYLAQLADRRGAEAAAGIKLMVRSLEEYSNPTPAQAAKLIANSRLPAPQLSDFIADAATRDPIACEPGDAKRVEDLPVAATETAATHAISVTNGWLVCDGKLLTGSSLGINWWRGNMHPGEAKNYGVNLTRFAPGRTGAGLTDDLNALADGMQADHVTALDHHYGLWYDRRREDHERVRRMDADAWAPFYEQPFARSGEDKAWDGLSKYDLTKFNPWYWSRLKSFAAICDRRGLVLFNENYFQHNILEAGAHWVDCPWRTANNINHTSFPEPPPFAGDKRIFMAEQFYDLSDPAYRGLHRNFIRQNLDNYTNNANVIQFTSAEFTGPLAFEQFWLDTVGEWENDTGRKPLVALSCPKNVQDAILADPKRRAVVDVICFRYWWQTDRGLFAPNGGQNLSPRQFERLWKGGTPSDLNLAAMAAEYRQKFLDKAVIASGEDEDMSHSAWAFLCAGGSLPNLPPTTDATLLAAIPRMQPWPAASGHERWALREAGQQILIHTGDHTPVDLSAETGRFKVQSVDAETGALSPSSETVQAGGTVTLPDGVLWLTRE